MAKKISPVALLVGLGAVTGLLVLMSSSPSKDQTPRSAVLPPQPQPPLPPSPQQAPVPPISYPSPSSSSSSFQQGLQDVQAAVQIGTDIYNTVQNAINADAASGGTDSTGLDAFSTPQ